MKMLVSITFDVDTNDPMATRSTINGYLYQMLSELKCKQPAQLVTSTADSTSVGGQYAES